jgi:asparagine synthase (glutamine-hydrolysing)
LEKSVSECKSPCISLSGGLDSSILAFFLQPRKTSAISIITKEFSGTDLTFCQMISKKFGLPLIIKMVEPEELITAINETIKILQVFNDIEIRNSIVMYLSIQAAKKEGHASIITGDGADELFAGYNFFLKMNENEIKENLKRIWKIMHFPTQKIGKSLKITIESPFLSNEMLDFAKSLPVDHNVRNEMGKKFGKWILRKTFEKKIPSSVVWRKKSAMQDGAGTSGLKNMFDVIIPDRFFKEQLKKIKESENVIIRSKESLHYYLTYRKYYDEPAKLHASNYKCPYCKYMIEQDSKFCRMCGAFPV